jgi:glycerol uptake facilitator-like aquaporin
MAERLAAGNIALALLANTIATDAVLVALILAFGKVSGAHLNPAVTVADALEGGIAQQLWWLPRLAALPSPLQPIRRLRRCAKFSLT